MPWQKPSTPSHIHKITNPIHFETPIHPHSQPNSPGSSISPPTNTLAQTPTSTPSPLHNSRNQIPQGINLVVDLHHTNTNPSSPIILAPKRTHPIQLRSMLQSHPYAFHTETSTNSSSSAFCEPTSYTIASASPQWRHAISTEIAALMHNSTWTLVPPTDAHNVVGCQWIYRIKRKADGSIDVTKPVLWLKASTNNRVLTISKLSVQLSNRLPSARSWLLLHLRVGQFINLM